MICQPLEGNETAFGLNRSVLDDFFVNGRGYFRDHGRAVRRLSLMPAILILNGPNLNLLGTREPDVYGADTLEDIMDDLAGAVAPDVDVRWQQSNAEGALIDALHNAMDWADGVVFNPGAYTHTSVALRDAISATGLPVIETHLSNVHAREPFRHISMLAGVCVGVVAGFGRDSYRVALDALVRHLAR